MSPIINKLRYKSANEGNLVRKQCFRYIKRIYYFICKILEMTLAEIQHGGIWSKRSQISCESREIILKCTITTYPLLIMSLTCVFFETAV